MLLRGSESMNEKIFNIIKDVIIPIFTITIPLIASHFTAKRNVPFSKRSYLTFKEIRKDYLEDKINGYYYFQSFIGLSIPKEEIDFILNSEKAFSIMRIIKVAHGKYTFSKGKFYSKLERKHYILPVIFYFISAVLIFMPIVFCTEILKSVKIYNYVFLMIFINCIFGPVLINTIQRIKEISSTRYLETLTRKRTNTKKTTKTNRTKKSFIQKKLQ